VVHKIVTIKLETGVHARPAAIFVRTANEFPCEIKVEKDKMQINGKSIMGLMTLAITQGSKIKIIAEGEKEAEALERLTTLIENSFHE